MIELSQDQIDFFHENGYLSLDRLVPADELIALRKAYDRIFEHRAGREVGDQLDLAGIDDDSSEASLPQIVAASKYAPEFELGEYRKSCERIIQQLCGPEAVLGGDHAILKPVGGPPTPWHQDEAYWDPSQNYQSVSIWIPLQDAPEASGCLHFVPGSHRLEVQKHQSLGGDVRIHALEVLDTDTSASVACPIPAGGCTIHDSRTLHYAGPNNSGEPRRALIVIGGAPSTPRTDGRRFPWNEMKKTARAQRAEDSGGGSL